MVLSLVFGSSGGIGGALVAAIGPGAVGFSRAGTPPFDITDEASVAAAAARVRGLGEPPGLIIVATGMLHGQGVMPEKTYAAITPETLARYFAINAIGPALIMKHFLPLLPKAEEARFAVLSARVGSITDNAIGGWYGYRAAKAALNQLLRSAAIELQRTRPLSVCVALHPGTVASNLSAPFAKAGLQVRPPACAAADLLGVLNGLGPADTGMFYAYDGTKIPW
ncbi:MAG: SDR family NAD(P)-dependent oxidoreductase [Acidocella sp.]|nr:SDR family NAD(P)-dependent oxidoreductase [Acidocella sp.]